MLNFIGLLTGLGPSLISLGDKLAGLVIARQQAKTQEELAKINQQIEEVHDKRAVLIAESGSRINSIIRAIAAIGPIAYLTKIFLWDKVIGSIVGCAGSAAEHCKTVFNTDQLDANLWWVVLGVIGFYFLVTKK